MHATLYTAPSRPLGPPRGHQHHSHSHSARQGRETEHDQSRPSVSAPNPRHEHQLCVGDPGGKGHRRGGWPEGGRRRRRRRRPRLGAAVPCPTCSARSPALTRGHCVLHSLRRGFPRGSPQPCSAWVLPVPTTAGGCWLAWARAHALAVAVAVAYPLALTTALNLKGAPGQGHGAVAGQEAGHPGVWVYLAHQPPRPQGPWPRTHAATSGAHRLGHPRGPRRAAAHFACRRLSRLPWLTRHLRRSLGDCLCSEDGSTRHLSHSHGLPRLTAHYLTQAPAAAPTGTCNAIGGWYRGWRAGVVGVGGAGPTGATPWGMVPEVHGEQQLQQGAALRGAVPTGVGVCGGGGGGGNVGTPPPPPTSNTTRERRARGEGSANLKWPPNQHASLHTNPHTPHPTPLHPTLSTAPLPPG
jgi:hypothetical protein